MNRCLGMMTIAMFLTSGAVASDPIWKVGKADNSSKEFANYRKQNPEVVQMPLTDSRQISKGLKGSINPVMDIRFSLPSVPKYGVMFSFKLLDAPASGAQMGVFCNDMMSGLIQLWGTSSTQSKYKWRKTYRLYIPREQLQAENNTLRLTTERPLWSDASVDSRIWWEWDYLQLESLSTPVREPVHGTVCYLGTTVSHDTGFRVDDSTAELAKTALPWLGIAYSGNTIRANFWYDVTQVQPGRKKHLETLRDLNMTVLADYNAGHIPPGADGKLPQHAIQSFRDFFSEMGDLIQFYELGNEPCMFWGTYSHYVAYAQAVNELKPEHMLLAAPGWAYGGGKGTPINWSGDVNRRRVLENLCQATNGHSYGYSYTQDKGGSFIENLRTYEGVEDGWPKPYINSETGSNNWHSEENGPKLQSSQPKASAFDRILRAHVAVVDRTMQHSLIFDDFGMFQKMADWSDTTKIVAQPMPEGQDTRLQTFRRLALTYATHGAPLPFEVLNKDALKGKKVYVRCVDTAAIPAQAGSGATANKVLLNFVNFENSPQDLKVKVRMPLASRYSGVLFGPGNTWQEARQVVNGISAKPWLELTVSLPPRESKQYVLEAKDRAVPYAPAALKTVPGDQKVELSWPGCAGADSYDVFRRKAVGDQPEKIASVKTTAAVDDKALAGETWTYEVRAVNSTGTSQPSAAATVTVGATVAPENLEVKPGDGVVRLRFKPVSTAAKYLVKRSTGGDFTKIAETTNPRYKDQAVENGKTYCYAVAAWNKFGEGPASSTVKAVPRPAPKSPAKPKAVAADGRVVLSWPSLKSPLTCNILRSNGNGKFVAVAKDVSENSWADDAVKNGTSYAYRIVAVNGGVESKPSSAATAKPMRGTLPSGWKSQCVGPVSQKGSASYNNGVFTLTGTGPDIWFKVDAMRLAYQSLKGDGAITAKVESFDTTHGWAKIGVMVRAGLAQDDPMALLCISPGYGSCMNWRTAKAQDCQAKGGNGHHWLRLIRKGNHINALVSTDGKEWKAFGEATVELPQNALIGLFVCSHDNGKLNKAVFSHVKVSNE